MLLESLVLGRSELDSLTEEGTSEFLGRKVAFPEDVVILEELQDSDSVFFDDLFHFLHKCLVSFLSIKVDELLHVCRLGAGRGSIDNVLKTVGVPQEFGVPNRVVFVAVNERDRVHLIFVDFKAQSVQHLSEDFGTHFERTKGVSVLEKALCIQSVSADYLAESLDDLLDQFSLSAISLTTAVDSGCADISDCLVDVLLETLACEDLVNLVGELLVLDMLSLFRCLEVRRQKFELSLGDGALGHGEANAELGGSDMSLAKAVEISEEL